MTPSPFTLALLWAIPSLMLVGLVLLASGIRERNWLQHETPDQMSFAKPLPLRMGAGAVGLTFVCIGLLIFITPNNEPHHHIADLLEYAICAGLACLFLSLSGPSQLKLDTSKRTYSWRWGAPWFRHARTGRWDDLAGIYVNKFKNGYILGVRWKQGSRSCCIGKFKAPEDAEQFAAQTAQKLGLARVASPPVPQLRDVFKF